MVSIIKGGFDEYGFPFLSLEILNKKKDLGCSVIAIIDTGAAHCLIREEIAIKLELEELRVADYRHPVFGKLALKEYLMDLCFSDHQQMNKAVIEGIRAGTLADPHFPASIIIGVEVLRHCTLEYSGPDKTFLLNINP